MSGLLLPLSHCLSVAGRVGPHVATRCRTPHSVVAVAVLEANIVLEHVFVLRGSVKPAALCGISSSSRLIGEQTKPVVGRFPCNPPVATSASLPLLPLCQPLPLQRPGESIERKELGVPLRDIRLRIMCQRERICGVAATLLVAALQLILGPRRHVPRRPAMVRRATEPLTANILAAGAGHRAQADKAATVDLLLRPEVEPAAPAPALSSSCGLSSPGCLVSNPFLAEYSVVADQAS